MVRKKGKGEEGAYGGKGEGEGMCLELLAVSLVSEREGGAHSERQH